MKPILTVSIIFVLIFEIISITFTPVQAQCGYGQFGCPPELVIQYNTQPLKQFKSGITIDDIKCKTGFELIGKRDDGSPACVTSNSFTKLTRWGWGYDPLHEWSFEGLNDTYKAGQNIEFSLKFKGYESRCMISSFPFLTVQYRNKTIWNSNDRVASCIIDQPVFRYFESQWNIGKNSTYGSLVLNQISEYKFTGGYGQHIIEKNVTITP